MLESKEVLRVDGIERRFLLCVPQMDETPRAMVLALHGSTQRGSLIRRTSGFDNLVAKHGVVMVYPDAIGGIWRDGREEDEIDDVSFISTLVGNVLSRQGLDAERVFIVGASNGGFMLQRLLCEVPEVFRAGASVIATMGLDTFNACFPRRIVSMFLIVARDDTIVPYDGGEVVRVDGGRYQGLTVSFEDALGFWVSHGNWSEAEPKYHRSLEKGVDVLERNYTSPDHEERLKVAILTGVGHHWFGKKMPASVEKVFGRTSERYKVSEEVWGFFAGFLE